MGSATNIDLAQEEQVDVVSNQPRPNPLRSPQSLRQLLNLLFQTPQSGITAGAIAVAQGRPMRTLGHRSHGNMKA